MHIVIQWICLFDIHVILDLSIILDTLVIFNTSVIFKSHDFVIYVTLDKLHVLKISIILNISVIFHLFWIHHFIYIGHIYEEFDLCSDLQLYIYLIQDMKEENNEKEHNREYKVNVGKKSGLTIMLDNHYNRVTFG